MYFFPDFFNCLSLNAFDKEYDNTGFVVSFSFISVLTWSMPSYTTWVEGKIILHLSLITSRIFCVPFSPTSTIFLSCSSEDSFLVRGTSVIPAKWCMISASLQNFSTKFLSKISPWMKSIFQFRSWLTLSDINLLSITKILWCQLTPEYNLHSSVPI